MTQAYKGSRNTQWRIARDLRRREKAEVQKFKDSYVYNKDESLRRAEQGISKYLESVK